MNDQVFQQMEHEMGIVMGQVLLWFGVLLISSLRMLSEHKQKWRK